VSDDLRERLREADPVTRENGLSGADIDSMRRQILSRATGASERRRMVSTSRMLVVTVACALIVGLLMASRVERREPVNTKPQRVERRQLQFETPGGTRIIWSLNPDFEL
jgi:hypothetical protein